MIYVPETRYGAILMDFVAVDVETANPGLASISSRATSITLV